MTIRVLSAADVDLALTPLEAVDAMRSAFGQISSGEAEVPIRSHIKSDHGLTLLMPAFLGRSTELGTKIASLFPENPERGLASIQGAVLILDGETGQARGLIDGARLTALRTAAGSGLATELLADPKADVLTIFGAGTQGRSHIEVLSAQRVLREIRIISRTPESARRLAEDVSNKLPLLPVGSEATPPEIRVMEDRRAALEGAGIVVAGTTSSTPVFSGSDVEVGAHVNGVGSYRPDMQEVDEVLVRRARVIVDQREAAWEEAGDLIIAVENGTVGRDIIDAELGEIVNGTAPTGREGHEITFFKSVGNAAQDIAIGAAVLAAAKRVGVGAEVPF